MVKRKRRKASPTASASWNATEVGDGISSITMLMMSARLWLLVARFRAVESRQSKQLFFCHGGDDTAAMRMIVTGCLFCPILTVFIEIMSGSMVECVAERLRKMEMAFVLELGIVLCR